MHHLISSNRGLVHAAHVAAAFKDWLRAEGDRLVEAADLLGGAPWRERAEAVIAAAANGVPLHALRADLAALNALLTLEPTDDPWSAEAARFLAVDPDDPRATTAMLCAEALERGLGALDRLEGAQVQEAA